MPTLDTAPSTLLLSKRAPCWIPEGMGLACKQGMYSCARPLLRVPKWLPNLFPGPVGINDRPNNDELQPIDASPLRLRLLLRVGTRLHWHQ